MAAFARFRVFSRWPSWPRGREIERIAVPAANAVEATLVGALTVAPLQTLADLGRALREGEIAPLEDPPAPGLAHRSLPDLAEVRGQPALRRALEIAAAGAHNLLITGPPGAGKSLGARRLPSILPEPTGSEAIEITRIASVAGSARGNGLAPRPFRAPHHSISTAGLVGGGNPPRAGEATLAHGGVLFLDEMPEFARSSLEALRQPLEDGTITITRSRHSVTLPTRFQLVAAANPCPCGHGVDSERCICSPRQAAAYSERISGALADRLDMIVAVRQPDADAMAGPAGERSATVRERVRAARERAHARLEAERPNAWMSGEEARTRVRLSAAAEETLGRAHGRDGLSGRGWDRVIKVAQTCADLAGADVVDTIHVGEALALRAGR